MKAPKLPPRQIIETPKHRRDLSLGQYVERYLGSRDVTAGYGDSLRNRISGFIHWYGSDPKIADLDCDVVNQWLSAMLTTDLRPHTIDGYRRCLRCVWFYAYQEGDNSNPPLRLKKIRTPQQRIEAFTHEQINKLLAAADKLPGFFPTNGVRLCVIWRALIVSAYSTGLRRGDLLKVKRAQIAADGSAVVVQSKTGHRVCVRFSPEAMLAINAMSADDDRAIPWGYHVNALPRQFRAMLKAAGIDRGSFRWLRRSAGSYAEAAQPGSGSRLLGHRTLSVFNGHYNDETISVIKPVAPPELPEQKRRCVLRERKPPAVRMAMYHGGRFELTYQEPITRKTMRVATHTTDEATALGLKVALEEKLREAMQKSG
jgi:integrase